MKILQRSTFKLNKQLNLINELVSTKDIYKGHSINKMNFALRVANRKHCLQLHHFQGNHL